MAALSFLNFNFELMRPECAGAFGALQKVQVAVYMPLFAIVVIAVYVLVKMATLSSGSAAIGLTPPCAGRSVPSVSCRWPFHCP